jgi:hypothetical protein
VPIGFYSDPTFSFGILFMISRKLLSAFETLGIHKLKILHEASSNPHQKRKHSKHLAGPN